MPVDLISLAIIALVAAACPILAKLIPGKLIPETVFLLIAGAVLGMIIRTKNGEENAEVNVPALVSSIFGVNEPALYAILLPRKRLMWATFLSAGVGGAVAGLMGAKLYSFGASGPLGFPSFINPAGIDTGFIGLVASGVIAFILALIAACVLGPKKDEGGASLSVKVD